MSAHEDNRVEDVRRPRGMAARRGGGGLRRLRWGVAFLLMGVTVVNYVDRTCLAFAAPTFKRELGVEEVQFSHVVMAFQLTYLVMQPISGRILDWLGVRIGMACAIAWWSAAQCLTACSGGASSLAALRALLGVGEAANFPAAAKAVSEWFPARERTLATGLINVGSGLGQMIAAPIVVALILHFGWRAAFVGTGCVGLIWLVLWLFLYRDPLDVQRSTAGSSAEAGEFEVGRPASGSRRVWAAVLGRRSFWGLAIARFFSEPAWQFFTYWIPLYLVTERRLDLKDIAVFGWLPFLAGDLGSLTGGALGPLFVQTGASVVRARKLSALVSATLMGCAVFVTTAPSATWAIAFFCVGAFAHQSMSATLLTLPADLFPGRAVGTANGLSGAAGGVGGMMFTGIVGLVVGRAGYAPVFAAIALFDFVGTAVLWGTLDEPVAPAAGELPETSAPRHAGTLSRRTTSVAVAASESPGETTIGCSSGPGGSRSASWLSRRCPGKK